MTIETACIIIGNNFDHFSSMVFNLFQALLMWHDVVVSCSAFTLIGINNGSRVRDYIALHSCEIHHPENSIYRGNNFNGSFSWHLHACYRNWKCLRNRTKQRKFRWRDDGSEFYTSIVHTFCPYYVFNTSHIQKEVSLATGCGRPSRFESSVARIWMHISPKTSLNITS